MALKLLLLAVGLAVAVCFMPQPDMVVPEDSLPFQDGSFPYASRDDLAFRHPCTPDAPCEAVEPLKVRRAQNRTFITPSLSSFFAASPSVIVCLGHSLQCNNHTHTSCLFLRIWVRLWVLQEAAPAELVDAASREKVLRA